MQSFRKKIKYILLYWFVNSLIGLARFFPRVWVMKFTGFLGGFAFKILKKPREITLTNISMVFEKNMKPDAIAKLGKKVFEMAGKNAGDIFCGLSVKNMVSLEQFVTVEGEENLEKAYAKGNGVIVMTAHYGAFELVGSYLGLKGYEPHIIGTALKDKRLNQLLVHNRTSRGAVAIERGQETLKVVRALKRGGLIVILIDQDTRVKSLFVDFMGRKAHTPVGGTLLALKTNAAVVPMYISLQKDNTQYLRILPEIEIERTGDLDRDLLQNTQVLTKVTEEAILQNPSQWVWMHRRWKTRPLGE